MKLAFSHLLNPMWCEEEEVSFEISLYKCHSLHGQKEKDSSQFEELQLQYTDRGTPGFCWGSGVPSGHIITLPQAHSNSLHPPAQNKLYSLNPFLSTKGPPNYSMCTRFTHGSGGCRVPQCCFTQIGHIDFLRWIWETFKGKNIYYILSLYI